MDSEGETKEAAESDLERRTGAIVSPDEQSPIDLADTLRSLSSESVSAMFGYATSCFKLCIIRSCDAGL